MYVEKPQEFISESELKEHPVLRGFYQTKQAPEIYVSKEGRVWSEIRETFIKLQPSKWRYPCFNSLEKTYRIHILLAETFLKKPETQENLEVNHRNGDKNDYSLTNLEWVTRRENVEHAIQTGLISKNLHTVLTKDLQTGEVREHRSLNECARFIECSASSIHSYLRKVPTALLKRRYDVIFKGGRWNSFTEKDVGRPGLGQRRPVIAFNEKEKTAIIYGSAQEASQHLGIVRTEITTRASGRRSPYVKGYRFIWLDEFRGSVEGIPVVSEKPAREYSNIKFSKPEKPIRVTYQDGSSEVFSGISVIAKNYSVLKETLQQTVRKNNGFYKDIHIAYL